jgi:hypothetical protein
MATRPHCTREGVTFPQARRLLVNELLRAHNTTALIDQARQLGIEPRHRMRAAWAVARELLPEEKERHA